MEKTGKIMISQSEMDRFLATGIVPERLGSWGIYSKQELDEVIQSGFFQIINDKSEK